jgi:ribonucleoside-diphosphate reductase alpha chain
LADYSRAEFDELNDYLDHERDMTFSYGAVKQLEGKYLVQNRVSRQIYETPQFLYMLVAMCLFAKYPQATRLAYVKKFYDAVSTFKISLPTPIMSGVRTPTRQFSSCVLIECDDSLDSINATTSAIVKYVSQRAGIGINAGRIRGLGSEIRGGEAQHTGCIPFFKMFQAAVKSCSQGGVRGGAATLFYPLVAFRSGKPAGAEKQPRRGRQPRAPLDYGVQINRLLYTRLIKGGDITCFPRTMCRAYTMHFSPIKTNSSALHPIRARPCHPQTHCAGHRIVFHSDAGARRHRPHLYPKRRSLQHPQPVRSERGAGAPIQFVFGNRAADQAA